MQMHFLWWSQFDANANELVAEKELIVNKYFNLWNEKSEQYSNEAVVRFR